MKKQELVEPTFFEKVWAYIKEIFGFGFNSPFPEGKHYTEARYKLEPEDDVKAAPKKAAKKPAPKKAAEKKVIEWNVGTFTSEEILELSEAITSAGDFKNIDWMLLSSRLNRKIPALKAKVKRMQK